MALATTSQHLTHLTLNGVDMSGQWLLTNGMQSLTEFRVVGCNQRTWSLTDNDQLKSFLLSKPQLSVFCYFGNLKMGEVIEALPAHVQTFIGFQGDLDYDIIDAMEASYDRLILMQMWDDVYDMRTIELTAYNRDESDLFYPLLALTEPQKVKTLKMHVNTMHAIAVANQTHYRSAALALLTELKVIELRFGDRDSKIGIEFIGEVMA